MVKQNEEDEPQCSLEGCIRRICNQKNVSKVVANAKYVDLGYLSMQWVKFDVFVSLLISISIISLFIGFNYIVFYYKSRFMDFSIFISFLSLISLFLDLQVLYEFLTSRSLSSWFFYHQVLNMSICNYTLILKSVLGLSKRYQFWIMITLPLTLECSPIYSNSVELLVVRIIRSDPMESNCLLIMIYGCLL